MSRPKFFVQHFVACLNAPWEGPPGPHTYRTLEGVSYRYAVDPFEEPPFIRYEFWLYARMFRVNNDEGEREFAARVIWQDAPGGPRSVQRLALGPVRFTTAHPVQSTAWRLQRLRLPGLGRYQFRLLVRPRGRWQTGAMKVVAREHLSLERGP